MLREDSGDMYQRLGSGMHRPLHGLDGNKVLCPGRIVAVCRRLRGVVQSERPALDGHVLLSEAANAVCGRYGGQLHGTRHGVDGLAVLRTDGLDLRCWDYQRLQPE